MARSSKSLFSKPIVPPAEVAVTQKGTLQKMGRRFKLWASRYYEIQGQNMYYYKTAHSKHKCLGYVDLKVCYHVEVSDASTFGYAFEVHTIHRVHIFAARTAEDRDLWMKCISDLMGGKAVYEASKSLPKTKTGRRARSARRRTIDSIPSDIIQGSPSPESKKKGRKTVLSQSFKSTSRPTSSVEPSPLLSTRKAVTVEIKPKEPTPTPKEPTPTPKEPTPTPREPTPTPREPTPTPKEPTPTPREPTPTPREPTPTPREPTPTPKEPTPTPREPTPTPKEPCEIVVKPPTPELPSEEARSQPSPVETIGNGVIPQVAEIESAAVNQAFTAENGQLVGQTVPSEGTISEDSLEQQEVPSEEVPSEAQTSVEEVKIATSNSQVSEAPVDPEVNTVKPLSASPMDRPKSPKARTGSPVFQRPATPSSPHVKPNKKISLANQLPQIPKTPQLPADVREYLSQHFVTDDIKDFLASLPEDEGSGEDIPLPEKYINHLSSNEHDSFPAMDGLRFFLADCA